MIVLVMLQWHASDTSAAVLTCSAAPRGTQGRSLAGMKLPLGCQRSSPGGAPPSLHTTARGKLFSRWPCSFQGRPCRSMGLRQGPGGSHILGADHARKSSSFGLHTARSVCRDNRSSADHYPRALECFGMVLYVGRSPFAKLESHVHSILEQPTWLLSRWLRCGALPLICLWFQAHRVLLRLHCRAPRAAQTAQRGGAAQATLLARRGCRCGFLGVRGCGCCFGRSLCCALLLSVGEARSPQAGVRAPSRPTLQDWQ